MSEKTTMQLVESVIVETVSTKIKLDLAEQAIQRVRELHKQSYEYCDVCVDYDGFNLSYPCPTIKALDGEQ